MDEINLSNDLEILSSRRISTTNTTTEEASLAPTLASWIQLHEDMDQICEATGSLVHMLNYELLTCDKAENAYDIETLKHQYSNSPSITYDQIPSALLTASDFPDGYETLQNAISDADSPQAFMEAIREVFEDLSTISVPVYWLRMRNPVPPRHGDTTHQDTRDIERDALQLNGQYYSGSEEKYQGIIKVIEETLTSISSSYMPNMTATQKKGLRQFARVLLNTGNRTYSGGNTFEAILNMLGSHPHALLVPNSEKATPVELDLRLGTFDLVQEKQVVRRWGLVGKISATTYYLLKDPETVEMDLGSLTGCFTVSLGLPLPLSNFDCARNEDNGNTHAHRTLYDTVDTCTQNSLGVIHITHIATNLKPKKY